MYKLRVSRDKKKHMLTILSSPCISPETKTWGRCISFSIDCRCDIRTTRGLQEILFSFAGGTPNKVSADSIAAKSPLWQSYNKAFIIILIVGSPELEKVLVDILIAQILEHVFWRTWICVAGRSNIPEAHEWCNQASECECSHRIIEITENESISWS